MQYPTRPNIPNPYQIAGQAATQLGGQVQQFGKEQDELAERFRLMMEKRAQAQIAEKQRAEEMAFKQSEEERRQKEFETKQTRETERQKFFARKPGAEGAPAYSTVELQNALGTGLIDANEYKQLQPKEPERFSAGGGYYQMGPDGKPQTIIAPKPEGGAEANWQSVERPDGLYQVNPKTGESRKVEGIAPKPVGVLTGKALENANNKRKVLGVARMQLKNLQDAWKEAKGAAAGPIGGRLPYPSGDRFDAAREALQVTIRNLTRTPGEGAMSDYESRLSQAQVPNRSRYEGTTEQQMQQLDDLINALDVGYGDLGATGNQGAQGGGFDDAKKARLEELRRKREQGTLR